MIASNQERSIEIQYLENILPIANDGQDVIEGLSSTPKTIPAKYFYDAYGSELFEQICLLPEYYPTRTETEILQQASAEIAELTGVCELVELGSGSSTKTRLLLSAYENLGQPWQYVPIDVSSEILKESALQLHSEYPHLSILGLVGTYEQALLQLPPSSLPKRMIVFLGSTLGNFTQEECDRLFNEVRDILQVGDYFLLGIDLQKPKEILEKAYNDSQGVTAKFNLNMLSHLNQRYEGNFDLNSFQHHAIYNQNEQQIEMYLRAKQVQTIQLKKLDLKIEIKAGESILTEISRKFNLEQMEEFLAQNRLKPIKYWTDEKQWFGLILSQLKEE